MATFAYTVSPESSPNHNTEPSPHYPVGSHHSSARLARPRNYAAPIQLAAISLPRLAHLQRHPTPADVDGRTAHVIFPDTTYQAVRMGRDTQVYPRESLFPTSFPSLSTNPRGGGSFSSSPSEDISFSDIPADEIWEISSGSSHTSLPRPPLVVNPRYLLRPVVPIRDERPMSAIDTDDAIDYYVPHPPRTEPPHWTLPLPNNFSTWEANMPSRTLFLNGLPAFYGRPSIPFTRSPTRDFQG